MHPEFRRLMEDATRLVRGGDLRGATAAIQAALRGAAVAPSPDARTPPAARGGVIDVETREIDVPLLRGERHVEVLDLPSFGGSGTFEAGRFSDGRLEREYKLYVPPQAGQGPLPLLVMLHGCKQDPDDFAAGTRMNEAGRRHGCYVLYPAQSARANPQRCWNWFKHSHQQRGRGEPALLAAMTRHVAARHPVDAARVYVAGLSAGGAMAAILGEAYPELYAAVGVHSGLACGAAKDLPSALAAMRSGAAVAARRDGPGLPTIVFHGDADATVHPRNGEQVIDASVGAAGGQAEVDRLRLAGARGCTRRIHRSPEGTVLGEHWLVHGGGHAWSGGSREGSYTDAHGPDATGEMLRFFLQHPRQ